MMNSTARIPSPEQCVIGPLLKRWGHEKPDDIAFLFDDGPITHCSGEGMRAAEFII